MSWHILASNAVACDNLHLRASAHHWHVSAFLRNRKFQGISYYIKNTCTGYPDPAQVFLSQQPNSFPYIGHAVICFSGVITV